MSKYNHQNATRVDRMCVQFLLSTAHTQLLTRVSVCEVWPIPPPTHAVHMLPSLPPPPPILQVLTSHGYYYPCGEYPYLLCNYIIASSAAAAVAWDKVNQSI